MLFFMHISILRRGFLRFCGQDTSLEVMKNYRQDYPSREREWGYISSTHKNNRDFVQKAVQQDGQIIEFVDQKFKYDEGLATIAARQIANSTEETNERKTILERVLSKFDRTIKNRILRLFNLIEDAAATQTPM